MVAFSSTILAIPTIIENEKRTNQNSYLVLAYLKEQCLPFFVMNLSLAHGRPIVFFKASAPSIEKEITGIARLKAKIINNKLDPQ